MKKEGQAVPLLKAGVMKESKTLSQIEASLMPDLPLISQGCGKVCAHLMFYVQAIKLAQKKGSTSSIKYPIHEHTQVAIEPLFADK